MLSSGACSAFVSLDGLQSPETDAAPAGSASDGAPDVSADSESDVTVASDADAAKKTIRFVQATANDYGSPLTMSAPVDEGNTVIVVSDNPSPNTVTVTDTAGNVYTLVIPKVPGSTGANISIFAAYNVKGGFTSFNVALADAGAGYIYYATEYSGLSMFDVSATASSTSTATDGLTTGLVSTLGTPELIFAYAVALDDLNPGTGFNLRSGFKGNAIEDQIVTMPGNYRATATSKGPDGADIVLVCFK